MKFVIANDAHVMQRMMERGGISKQSAIEELVNLKKTLEKEVPKHWIPYKNTEKREAKIEVYNHDKDISYSVIITVFYNEAKELVWKAVTILFKSSFLKNLQREREMLGNSPERAHQIASRPNIVVQIYRGDRSVWYRKATYRHDSPGLKGEVYRLCRLENGKATKDCTYMFSHKRGYFCNKPDKCILDFQWDAKYNSKPQEH